jgi:hypothetical protein
MIGSNVTDRKGLILSIVHIRFTYPFTHLTKAAKATQFLNSVCVSLVVKNAELVYNNTLYYSCKIRTAYVTIICQELFNLHIAQLDFLPNSDPKKRPNQRQIGNFFFVYAP